ncbi:MAG: phosphoethanolamine--lipid A transferase EptA [Sphingobacteriaceae bacterium]|nr:phosphoethanolamine--lipid A transferase EptA [Sphingobacteriaceae bacterium]
MFKNNLKLSLIRFSLLLSVVNFIFFHYPFFNFVFRNIGYTTFNGICTILSLVILMLVLNALMIYIFFYLSRRVSKFLMVLFFVINAIAVYFINTYAVIIDESMIGNVLNTNYAESSSYFSIKLIVYILFLGILPSIFFLKINIIKVPLKSFLKVSSLTLLSIALLIGLNSTNFLWIDKHSKQLGGLAMPWSYTVNISLFYIHKNKANEKEIILPNARIKDKQKSVMVLVIGESARKQNFSLYGYSKNTNPLLSATPNVFHFEANSCATYTTAGLKCILEHTNTSDLYEILPNYLYRNDVEVIWRTTNWGEPPLHIKNYQSGNDLRALYKDKATDYDEILVAGLKEQILASKKDKILIVLHTNTSHGPSYNEKYPSNFEKFKPVCKSVELGNCAQTELINAYDNTILYTDYILSQVIENLKSLKAYKSSMIFVSDHGESLGENKLYMHGLPMSLAPKEQYEIPFIVWVSDSRTQLKPNQVLSQNHVFHSVLNFLSIESPIYKEEMNIFK